jgi:hypothetical protein
MLVATHGEAVKTITEHVRDHLLVQAGVFEPVQTVDLESEWSDRFEQLMRNRMKMGSIRYGPFRQSQAAPSVRVSSMQKRMRRYMETGNTECLVDIANLCLIEFCTTRHHKAHFAPIDGDDAEITRVQYG